MPRSDKQKHNKHHGTKRSVSANSASSMRSTGSKKEGGRRRQNSASGKGKRPAHKSVRIQPPKTRHTDLRQAVNTRYSQRGIPRMSESSIVATRPAPTRRQMAQVVQALLYQYSSPGVAPLVRLLTNNEFQLIPTALARLKTTFTVDWTAIPDFRTAPELNAVNGTSNASLLLIDNPYHFPFVLTRDPMVRAIYRVFCPPGISGAEYTAKFYAVGEYDSFFAAYLQNIVEPWSLPIAYLYRTGSWPCYSDFHPGGSVGEPDKRVVWLDGSSVNPTIVTFSCDFNESYPDVGGLQLIANRWDSDASFTAVDQTTLAVSGEMPNTAGGQVRLEGSGYYEFVLQISSASGAPDHTGFHITNLTMSFEITVNAVYQHLTLPDIVAKSQSIDGSRILGSSAWFANTIQQLSLGGTISMAQVDDKLPWYSYFTDETKITNLPVMAQASKNWADGAYQFVRPSSADALRINPLFCGTFNSANLGATQTLVPCFRPFRLGGAVVTRIMPPELQGGGLPTSKSNITVFSVLEFTTRDQFFDTEFPQMTAAEFDLFVEAARAMPQFYDNPLHWADISKYIRSFLEGVVKYGPLVATVITHALPLFAL